MFDTVSLEKFLIDFTPQILSDKVNYNAER